jgi:hypothetical protein
MRTYSNLKLEEFKDFLNDEDYKKCDNKKLPGVWYPLTSKIFIQFFHRVSHVLAK